MDQSLEEYNKWGEESDDPMGIYVTALEPLPQITRIMDAGAQE